MANRKITDLTDIGTPDPLDVLEIVDVSTNTSKKVLFSELGGGGGSQSLDEVLAEGSVASMVLTDGSTYDVNLPFDDGFDIYMGDIVTTADNNNQALRIMQFQAINNTINSEVAGVQLSNMNIVSQLFPTSGDYNIIHQGTKIDGADTGGVQIQIPTPKTFFPNGQVNYKFPYKEVTGDYTLATLDDIPTVANATETVAGIAEIATTAEVATGTDDTTIVTPLKLKQVTDNYMQVILNCNVLGTTVNGGTNIVLYQIDVPANTFSDLDAFEIEALGAKVGTTAASTIRLWTDTASTFNSGTAQLLALSASLGATNLYQSIKREFHVRGTTVKVLANTVGVATDEATAALAANPWASYTFNPAVANTLYFTVTGNAADTFTKQNYKITRYKNKSTI